MANTNAEAYDAAAGDTSPADGEPEQSVRDVFLAATDFGAEDYRGRGKEAFDAAVLDAAGFGYGIEAASGISAGVSQIADEAKGLWATITGGKQPENLSYMEHFKDSERRQEEIMLQNPNATLGGTVVGSIGSGVGAAKLLWSGGSKLMPKTFTYAGRTGLGAAGTRVLIGTGEGFLDGATRAYLGSDLKASAGEVTVMGVTDALFGAGFGAVVEGAGWGVRAFRRTPTAIETNAVNKEMLDALMVKFPDMAPTDAVKAARNYASYAAGDASFAEVFPSIAKLGAVATEELGTASAAFRAMQKSTEARLARGDKEALDFFSDVLDGGAPRDATAYNDAISAALDKAGDARVAAIKNSTLTADSDELLRMLDDLVGGPHNLQRSDVKAMLDPIYLGIIENTNEAGVITAAGIQDAMRRASGIASSNLSVPTLGDIAIEAQTALGGLLSNDVALENITKEMSTLYSQRDAFELGRSIVTAGKPVDMTMITKALTDSTADGAAGHGALAAGVMMELTAAVRNTPPNELPLAIRQLMNKQGDMYAGVAQVVGTPVTDALITKVADASAGAYLTATTATLEGLSPAVINKGNVGGDVAMAAAGGQTAQLSAMQRLLAATNIGAGKNAARANISNMPAGEAADILQHSSAGNHALPLGPLITGAGAGVMGSAGSGLLNSVRPKE